MKMDLKNRMLTRHWKKKALEEENEFNSLPPEEKKRISKLCGSSRKVKHKETEESLPQKYDSIDKIENIEWIMCDACQKWRKISSQDAKEFHGTKKWFCSLNKDLAFNQCFAPEQSYLDFVKIIHQEKFDIILYGLQLGDLVWGKMKSFHRWPALITCDPVGGQFLYYESSYETEYHVEFLGPKHSHAWLKGYCIEIYSGIHFKSKNKKKKKMTKREQKLDYDLQNAIQEANGMMVITNDKRLESCIFENANGKLLMPESQVEFHEFIQPTLNKTWTKDDSTIVQICHKPNGCCRNEHEQNKSHNLSIEPFTMPCEDNTNCKNSSLTLTPQQRLSLDFEIYKKSEVAFTVDLKQFLARNNLQLEPACWENVPVNSYQLFQAVNDLGGYETVTLKSKWTYIYREITNTQEKYKGKQAKKFYYRNLYAYALYKSGEDYKYIIQEILANERIKDKSLILKKSCEKMNTIELKLQDDLFVALEELENTNKMCYFEEEIKSAEKNLGISIQFHDESSPVCSLEEYEFPLIEKEFPLIESEFSEDSELNTTEGFQFGRLPFDDQLERFDSPGIDNQNRIGSDNLRVDLEDLHALQNQIETMDCGLSL